MKNYNKILEAVNRGIQLALDDFDDEEQVQNIKSKQIIHRDYTKEYLDLMKIAVDLGLPSGTLWCKCNLGATCENTPESWYGDYYAWGDLEPNKTDEDGKIYFDWSNYKFGDFFKELTKYCNNPVFGLKGFTDNLTLLHPKDDAAYQNKKLHNFNFYIPTKEQCEELIKYTNNYWVKNYDPTKLKHNSEDDGGIQGLNGGVFEGKNRNQLFIPAAGSRDGFLNKDTDSCCRLWSSSLCLNNPGNIYYLLFKANYINMIDFYGCGGQSVRPVINL